MRRARHLLATAAVLAVTLAVTGCTGGDDEPDGDDARPGPGASGEPSGPSAEELSAEVLEQGRTQQDAPAVASASGTFTNGTTLTVDVVGLERTAQGTLLTARLSGDGQNLGPAQMKSARNDGVNFARDVYLVDAQVSASRYLPLQFEDYRQACLCPYLPLPLGAEPQTVTALYPPLPAGVSTVDVVFNGQVTVTGVPVGS